MNQNKILFVLAIGVVTSIGLVTPLNAYATDVWITCASPPGENPAPAEDTTLNYAVINNNLITSAGVIPDSNNDTSLQTWNPNGNATSFNVPLPPGSGALSSSVIAISTNDPASFNLCGVNYVNVVEDMPEQTFTKTKP